MVQVDKIKGKLKEKGYNQSDLAKYLGISTKTLSTRFKNKVFGSDEIEKMIPFLDIKDPIEIFFKQ